jgi:hypothetical protein
MQPLWDAQGISTCCPRKRHWTKRRLFSYSIARLTYLTFASIFEGWRVWSIGTGLECDLCVCAFHEKAVIVKASVVAFPRKTPPPPSFHTHSREPRCWTRCKLGSGASWCCNLPIGFPWKVGPRHRAQSPGRGVRALPLSRILCRRSR